MRHPLSILFPRMCPGCRCVLETAGLCGGCWKHLDFITIPFCAHCGGPFPFEGYADICWKCQKSAPLFHSHRSLLRYNALSRRLIFSLKHGRDRTMVPLFGQWLVPLVLALPVDIIVPVPLHWTRLAYRCFNQSALIAQHVAQLTGLPCRLTGLKRVRRTPSQGKKTPAVRARNMENAFRPETSFDTLRVLLIDDVYTTGATLNACSHALLEAGASRIHALTLAKVVLGNDTHKSATSADPPGEDGAGYKELGSLRM